MKSTASTTVVLCIWHNGDSVTMLNLMRWVLRELPWMILMTADYESETNVVRNVDVYSIGHVKVHWELCAKPIGILWKLGRNMCGILPMGIPHGSHEDPVKFGCKFWGNPVDTYWESCGNPIEYLGNHAEPLVVFIATKCHHIRGNFISMYSRTMRS